jgi:hypothetical protein
MLTLGSHQRSVGKSQVHITPRWLLDRLGPFDLDPGAADPRPWDCARVNITERENGLAHPWRGRVLKSTLRSISGRALDPAAR